MSRIVVGVDGSETAQQALQWAVEEARLRGAELEAVYVFEPTPSWQLYGYGEDVVAPSDIERMRQQMARAEEHARQRARGLVDSAIAAVDGGDVQIKAVILEDRRPARALVDHAADADMVVLGSRGRGGFAGLLLGSVSQQVAQHARCPVVIISPRTAEQAAEQATAAQETA